MAATSGSGAAPKISWWAIAPFGRVGKALGFRWIFFFTFPIPFHPLLAAALLLAPVAGLLWALAGLIGGGEPSLHWLTLAGIGALLTVPLSIPILNWIGFAFRLPLIQALCFLGAMILLGVEVALGRAPPLLGILPLLFFGTHLVAAVRSRVEIARWKATNRAFRPVQLEHRPVRLSGAQLYSEAGDLIRAGLTSVVDCDSRDITGSVGVAGRTVIKVAPDDHARFKELLGKQLRPDGWQPLEQGMVQVPASPIVPDVAVSWDPVGQPGSGRKLVTVEDRGEVRRLVVGTAAPITLLPLFVLFYAVSLTQGRSEWVAGFQRGRARPLPSAPTRTDSVAKAVFDPVEDPAPPVDAAHFFKRLEQEQEAMLHEAERELAPLLSGRAPPYPRFFQRYRERPERLAGMGEALCDLLARSKEKRDEHGAYIAADLLSALPGSEFGALRDKLLPLVGSRILALRWKLTPDLDVAPLPRDCPKFGSNAGFGLLKRVPRLWERLDELGPRGAKVTAALIAEVGEDKPLVAARERLRQRGLWAD